MSTLPFKPDISFATNTGQIMCYRHNEQPPLTDSSDKGYIRFSSLSAGVAKLAYAADSKLEFCNFCPLRNSSQPLDPTKENDLDTLKPFAGLLGNF